ALAMHAVCPNLRFVQYSTCDYPQQSLAELQSKGPLVSALGGALAGAIGDLAIGLMQAVLAGRKSLVRPGTADWEHGLANLRGKAIGIIGLGRVGTAVARRLRPTGVHLTYSDVRTIPHEVSRELMIRRSTLDRLLVESDVVTVHAPLTDQSKNSIARREFGLIGTETVLVNTSDLAIVERSSLLAALKDHRVRGYGTTDLDPGLAGFSNVVQASPDVVRTTDAGRSVAAWIIENARLALSGGRPHGLVETIGFPRAGDPAFWSSRMAPRESMK
ncbi:MAG: hypothetical protein HY682_08645, partial [Chloroflexi bacterium]|nr:hypothetical protein [Chloroflexota bacterium]